MPWVVRCGGERAGSDAGAGWGAPLDAAVRVCAAPIQGAFATDQHQSSRMGLKSLTLLLALCYGCWFVPSLTFFTDKKEALRDRAKTSLPIYF